MLSKIILGTANFTQRYGVFSNGSTITTQTVDSILQFACENEIETLDTAVAYGNVFEKANSQLMSKFNIITKLSLEELESNVHLGLESQFQSLHNTSLLLHDPHNIDLKSVKKYRALLLAFKNKYNLRKIGVSVYDMSDVELFSEIYIPDIIQIPLNPLNQQFNNQSFKSFIKQNKVEVIARSLFLQGVLLAKNIPAHISNIEKQVMKVQRKLDQNNNKLQNLLNWAFSHKWVNSWILGVSELKELEEIVNAVRMVNLDHAPEFEIINIPGSDPRSWAKPQL